jgi:uncharacterized membrane protein YccC
LPLDALSATPGEWMKKPDELRRACCAATRIMATRPAVTPSSRLLTDCAAEGMLGLAHALNGLTLIFNPARALRVRRVSGSRIADWLPPFVNAIRTFAVVSVVSLFWVETAWPNGMTAVSFAAIIANLFPLRGRSGVLRLERF